jgi:hypothetical protein
VEKEPRRFQPLEGDTSAISHFKTWKISIKPQAITYNVKTADFLPRVESPRSTRASWYIHPASRATASFSGSNAFNSRRSFTEIQLDDYILKGFRRKTGGE